MPTDHSFRIPRPLVVLGSLVLAATLLPASAGAAQSPPVRFATFNASLNRNAAGQRSPTSRPRTTPRRRPSPRSSSGRGPTCC